MLRDEKCLTAKQNTKFGDEILHYKEQQTSHLSFKLI